MASLKGLLHFQSEVNLQSSDKKIGVDTTSVRSESGGGKRYESQNISSSCIFFHAFYTFLGNKLVMALDFLQS